MLIRYVGLFREVQIAVTGQNCPKGEAVDVPDELGRSLLEQSVWEPVAPDPEPEVEEEE